MSWIDAPCRAGTLRAWLRPRRAALSLALLACGLVPPVATAVEPIVVAGVPGLTAAPGLARDAHGDLWVADSGGGVCRLLDPPFATFEGLVCPDKELQGPKSPGQMAFDVSTGSIFVGDSASAGGGVWRLHLNQSVTPAVITSATLLEDVPDDRVLGMAYDGARDVLDYTTANSPAVRRIEDPTTCAAPCTSTTAGSAVAKGAPAIVHDDDGRLYLAEAGAVTMIADPGSPDVQALPVAGLDTGVYNALAFDPAADGDGRIYAGTNNPVGVDWIDALRVADGTVADRYAAGFSGVTAIGIDTRGPDDRPLDVIDDSSAKQVGEDTVGAGRRLTVPFERLDRATFVTAPAAVINMSTATFAFTAPIDTTFWCRLDADPPQECGSGLAGQVTYDDLADGFHSVLVQIDNQITGGRVRHWFEVDTSAPSVTLGPVVVSGTSAQIAFTADDLNVDFSCALDDDAPVPCDSPVRYTELAYGEHRLTVVAEDFAGNPGQPVSTRFTVVPPPPPPAPAISPTPINAALVAVTPTGAATPPTPTWKPGRIATTLRGRVLQVAFDAPPGTRYARFTLTRSRATVARLRVVPVTGGRRNVVRIVVSRALAKRIRTGRLTLAIHAGATPSKLATSAGRASLRHLATSTRATSRDHGQVAP